MSIKIFNDAFRNQTHDLPACSAVPQPATPLCAPRKVVYFNKIGISHNCKEKDLEICAFELETEASKSVSLSLYRVLSGGCIWFSSSSDGTLK
jgi:hypothetical protein